MIVIIVCLLSRAELVKYEKLMIRESDSRKKERQMVKRERERERES